MLRRLIDWVLYKLKIKHKIERPPLEALKDLIPFVFVACILISIFKHMGVAELNWWQKVVRWIQYKLRYLRFAIIGY